MLLWGMRVFKSLQNIPGGGRNLDPKCLARQRARIVSATGFYSNLISYTLLSTTCSANPLAAMFSPTKISESLSTIALNMGNVFWEVAIGVDMKF